MNDIKMDVLTVSICCITYNHQPYIHKCIEGFLMQQTNFKFEVLIHDDASTDNTANIIREYESKYPEIIKPIYQIENQYSKGIHVSSTFNFSRVKGKYIAICEGDDYWTDPYKLQKQVDFLDNHPDYFMCVHNAMVHNHLTNQKYLFNKKKIKESLAVKDVILRPWFTPTASFLFRREGFDFPDWKGVNGDMQVLFSNITKGKLHYDNSSMSVYNFSTPSSLSYRRQIDFKNTYNRKISLLKSFNKYSKEKYALFVIIKMIGVFIKYIIRQIKYRIIK